MMLSKTDEEAMRRIRVKITDWAKDNVIDFRQAWKTVYTEYQERTGVNPWQGQRGSGMDNILYQTGTLDVLEAVVDELTFKPEN